MLFHIIILLIYIIHNKTEYFRIQIREIDYKSIKAKLDKKANGETSGADTKTSANTVTDPWCSNPWGPEATDKQKRQIPSGWWKRCATPSPHHLFKEHSHIAPRYRCTLSEGVWHINACIKPVESICYDNIMPDGWQCYIDSYDENDKYSHNAYWTSSINKDTPKTMVSKKANNELNAQNLWSGCASAYINSERANRRENECKVKKGVGYLYNISTGETKKFINDSELKGLIRNINKNKKPINDLDKIYPNTNNKEYNIILDKYV